MEAKVKKTKDLYLRKIDIKKWSSDVARQFGIRSIPHFRIYNPEGKMIKKGFKVYKDILNWKSPPKDDSGQKATPPVKTISHGKNVNLEDHLVKGKYTLIEYYADW